MIIRYILNMQRDQLAICKDMLAELNQLPFSLVGFIAVVSILLITPITLLPIPYFNRVVTGIQDEIFSTCWMYYNRNN